MIKLNHRIIAELVVYRFYEKMARDFYKNIDFEEIGMHLWKKRNPFPQ